MSRTHFWLLGLSSTRKLLSFGVALGLALTGCSSDNGPVVGTGGSGGSGGSGGVAMAGSSGDGGAAPPNTAGSGGSAGLGGSAGGTAGSGGAGGAGGSVSGDGDTFVTDVSIEVHEDVNTILVVNWTQAVAAENTWLEFTFEAGNVMTSRPAPGVVGPHRDVVLGVPGQTEVTVRIVSQQDGVAHVSSDHKGTTEAVPSGMPEPTVLAYDAALASDNRWMFGAVEDSDGGCDNQSCFYHTTFWVYIMDRKGRIVWYYADPSSNATSSFQRIARDGEYIWIEKRPFGGQGERGVLKMTLDWQYFEEVPVADLADCIDVTDDGSLLFDANNVLREMTAAGAFRNIWDCREHFGNGFECYTNTVNWNPLDDTILLSFPYENTVIEVARQNGAVVGQYGAAPGSYAFSPATWEFGFQHFANITHAGTLMVSSHMPGADEDNPQPGDHAFMEFEINRQTETLIEKWIYSTGPEWALYKGMAIRLPDGNTLANYGTGGAIREITPDKQTAFHVKFDAEGGNDLYNKMVGHNVLIDDLYALNGGGPE
jgi:hypothetical protein